MLNKDHLIIVAAWCGLAVSLVAGSWLLTGPFPGVRDWPVADQDAEALRVLLADQGLDQEQIDQRLEAYRSCPPLAPLNQQRAALQLTANPEVTKNMPPEIAFGYVMFGSFRGLAVDILWGRATRLKEEGKFYEAMQLSEWICNLQPRFPQVWAFHAWNMAYNISVATHTERERWMWVRSGIDLLRDRGIPLNPASTQLYKELAWIFLHKVGQFSDDMHYYYKRELAREWHELLGPPPTGATEAVLERFEPIAEAHRIITDAEADELGPALDAFTAVYPDVRSQVRQVRGLGHTLDGDLLRALGRLNDRARLREAGIWPADQPLAEDADQQKLVEWFFESTDAQARDRLLAFLRAYVLSHEYHMDPAFMMELMEGQWLALPDSEFVRSVGFDHPGAAKKLPLDFRHPAAHGLYWSALGVRVAENERNADADETHFQVLNTDRQILHALQALTHNGRITYDPVTGYYSQLPDARYITAYERAVLTAGQRIGGQYLKSAAPDSFRAGHENFLIWSMQLAYVYGSREQAQEIYARLQHTYGKFKPDRIARYSQTLDEFLLKQFTENMTGLDEAAQFITGNLTQALLQGYANGNTELAARRHALARQVHQWYQNKQGRETFGTTVRDRMALPSLAQMEADALENLLLSAPQRVSPLLKARIWTNVPVHLQQRVYDRVRAPLYRQVNQMSRDLDPAALFAQPPGMAEYRKAHPPTTPDHADPPDRKSGEPAAPQVERQ